MHPNTFTDRPLQPVEDEGTLAAIPKRARRNDQPCYVIGINAIYYWRHTSTKAAMAGLVVVPDDVAADPAYIASAASVPGRWELGVGAGSGRVTNVDELASLSVAEYENGALVTTSIPGAIWRLNKFFAGDAVADPRKYIQAAVTGDLDPGDNGTWVRDTDAGEAGADSVPNWYVDPSNPSASDDNASGQDDFVFETINEALYRIGKQPIDGAIIGAVNINLAAGTFQVPFPVDVKFKNDGALVFIGTKTIISTHTITAVTAWITATGVVGQYTLSGAPDLTSLVGAFVRINAGARLGNKTTIAKAISPGVFRGTWADQQTGASIEPQVGDAVEVYSCTKILGDVRINSSAPGVNGGTVYFQDCEIGSPGDPHSVIISSGQAQFIACRIYGLDIYEPASLVVLNCCHVTECRSYGYTFITASTFTSAGGTALSARGKGVIHISTRCLVQSGGMIAGHLTEGPGHIRVESPMAIVDYNVPAIIVLPGSTVVLDDVATFRDVNGASFAVTVAAGSSLFYASAKPPVIVGGVPSPAGNDYKIGGTTKAKAALPYFEAANGAVVAVNQ